MSFYFYIMTPGYRRDSAGIRSLHQLCHELNMRGYPAFVPKGVVNPDLNTPVFSSSEARGKMVAVYGEGISGNPWKADIVVRWLLSPRVRPAGVEKSDLLFAWDKSSAREGEDLPRLWLPMVDESVYFESAGVRSGRCLYASRHADKVNPDHMVGTTPLSTVAPGDWQGLARIYRTSEYLISYEVSSVTTEAAFCGCPTIFALTEPVTEEFLEETAKVRVPETVRGYLEDKRDYPQMFGGFLQAVLERAS